MAKDYKGRPRGRARGRSARGRSGPKSRAAPRVPAWVGLVAGLAIGLGVALAVHLHHTGGLGRGLPGPAGASAPAAAREAPRPAGDGPRTGTRFEFYSLLPEMEVVVPEAELRARSPKPANTPGRPGAAGAGETPRRAERYVLQAGAFRRLQDADRLRASLALAGLEAKIQTVAVDGERAWHRVRLGPFADVTELREARERLRAIVIDPMVLRIKT